MKKTNKEKPLKFPCRFPIKIIGATGDAFEAAVFTIINKYVPDLYEGAIIQRESKGRKYTCLTITIEATSQKQLDNIYKELSLNEEVIFAL